MKPNIARKAVLFAFCGHLGRNWSWIVLRRLVAVLFGIAAFACPKLPFNFWGRKANA